MKRHRSPWWQLCLLVPFVIGLDIVEQFTPLPGIPAADVGAAAAFVTFGAVLLWIHFNGGLTESYGMGENGSLYDLNSTMSESDRSESNDGHDPGDWLAPVPSYQLPPHGMGQFAEPEEQKWLLN